MELYYPQNVNQFKNYDLRNLENVQKIFEMKEVKGKPSRSQKARMYNVGLENSKEQQYV